MARETGTTSSAVAALLLVVPICCRRIAALLASLLLSAPGAAPPLRAAERLELRLDGLEVPLNLRELEDWSRDPQHPRGDLGAWLDLIQPASRQALLRFLRAPLVRDRSLAHQLVQSWAGQRLLEELGGLIGSDTGNGAPLLLQALRQLLAQQSQVTTIELLRAAPTQQLSLNLDALVQVAGDWREQLQRQQQALRALRQLPLRERGPLRPISDGLLLARDPLTAQPQGQMQPISLPVAHRPQPLQLQVWPAPGAPAQGAWVLLTPGLGGSTAQLEWLAASLQERGWPVVLLDHPGSDEQAVRELLDGRRLPPGAETLSDRLRDLQAVVAAEQQGRLPPLGSSVVLMGHSMGGLTALLAAGLRPEPGLARRCERALKGIPLINLSQLLQCQITQVPLPPPRPLAQPLAGVVSFNGFGSLLWPHRGLRGLQVPVLLVGGSLDLITPPLSEQLQLFLPVNNPASRLVLLEGGSHFSPVRIRRREQALFQLGEELVGTEPVRVQALMLSLSSEFLQGLQQSWGMPVQRRQLGGVWAYVLDGRAAEAWRSSLRP
jgi:predicted dienelactone hydrolase